MGCFRKGPKAGKGKDQGGSAYQHAKKKENKGGRGWLSVNKLLVSMLT